MVGHVVPEVSQLWEGGRVVGWYAINRFTSIVNYTINRHCLA